MPAGVYFHFFNLPFSIDSMHLVYVLTASSYKYPTNLWAIFGDSKYMNPKPQKNTPCAKNMQLLNNGPGYFSSRAVNKCMRSFYASSSRWWIQPLSCYIVLRDLRCRLIPPMRPGTPATVSRNIIRFSHSFSPIFFGSYILKKSKVDRTTFIM